MTRGFAVNFHQQRQRSENSFKRDVIESTPGRHGVYNKRNTMKKISVKISSVCVALALGLPLVGAITAVSGLTGCAGNQNERSTGEYIDDQSLTVRVKKALGDNSEYKFDNVSVNVFRGTVQLSGFVNTDEQKSRAVEIARGVQGVRKVEDQISIKPNP